MKIIILMILLYTTIYAEQNSISIDEEFGDWDTVKTYVNDLKDNTKNGVDYKKIWVTNDENYLFIRIDLFNETLIQEDTSVVLLINADNDRSTGSIQNNTGAEIKYLFGKRYGYYYFDNDSIKINHADIKLISAPTVSSSSYELCISLNSIIDDNLVFSSHEIEIKLTNLVPDIDEIPDKNKFLYYKIIRDLVSKYHDFEIRKEDPDRIRVLSYNVHKDDIFKPELFEVYKRIFTAVNPDIIAFQEIYDHSSEEALNLVEQFLPSNEAQEWYHSKIEPVDTNYYNRTDLILISRFKILESFRIQGIIYESYGIDRSNSGYLIELQENENNLLLINAHPPCCQANSEREVELQEIMKFIKDFTTQDQESGIKRNTPIIIVGDMNLVGPAYQREILVEGNFINNVKYGDDFTPDWDGTYLTDSKPYSTGFPGVITWYNEDNEFSPGRLDYIIYSDYTLKLENSFSLFTKFISPDILASFNLNEDDVILASDHLPLVADFSLNKIVSVNKNVEIPNEFKLYQNYPNPFNPATMVKFSLPFSDHVQIKVFDILGREIKTLLNEYKKAGNYEIEFNAAGLPNGIYLYRITSGDYTVTKKMILLK